MSGDAQLRAIGSNNESAGHSWTFNNFSTFSSKNDSTLIDYLLMGVAVHADIVSIGALSGVGEISVGGTGEWRR